MPISCPSSLAKLVTIAPISHGFMVDIPVLNGCCKPLITEGAPPCKGSLSMFHSTNQSYRKALYSIGGKTTVFRDRLKKKKKKKKKNIAGTETTGAFPGKLVPSLTNENVFGKANGIHGISMGIAWDALWLFKTGEMAN